MINYDDWKILVYLLLKYGLVLLKILLKRFAQDYLFENDNNNLAYKFDDASFSINYLFTLYS